MIQLFRARCLIPRFDGVILSHEWKEALWDKFVMAAPRPRTLSEQQYSDRVADGAPLETAVSDTPGWSALEELVATSAQLTNTMAADPLAHVVQGHRRFRRYAPRMLKALDIKAAPVAISLVSVRCRRFSEALWSPSLVFFALIASY